MSFSSGLLLLTTGFLMGVTLTLLNVIKPQNEMEVRERRDDIRTTHREERSK